MKVPPTERRSGILSPRLAVFLVAVVAIPLLAFAAAPAWWSQRGVLAPNAHANDYAPVNQGQLKNIARAAMNEMDARLPGGAGSAVHALIDAWSAPSTQANDFALVNVGQLKNVAKPFYDRLIAAALVNAYPWHASLNSPADFAIANIGQVKNLFGFDLVNLLLDSDGNGLPDAWEQHYFGNLGVDPGADPDGDAVTNLEEYQRSTDPTHPDPPPGLWLTPDHLTVVINPGQALTREETLNLSNTSSAALGFQLTPRNNTVDGASFDDSDQVSGPVYQWEDITNTGTLLPSVSDADDGFESFDLGFAFPYFGQSFTSVFVSSNGFITFGEGSDQFDNRGLPGTNMPANEIAAFHTDLNTAWSGDIYYLNEADRTIIQFQEVARYESEGHVTFQIVLKRDGGIEIRYKELPAVANDVTVGLQNATRDKGLTIAYARDYLHANLAVRIAIDKTWLTVSPASGLLGPSQAQTVTVDFDATGLATGRYSGSIEVSSDPSAPVPAAVPVTMIVNDPPTVSLIAPDAGTAFLSRASLTLAADAADSDGTVTTVQFFADGQLLGEATSLPFTFAWSAPTAGSHVLSAKATDDLGASTLSAPVNINVLADNDGDMMSDDWELAHFGDLSQNAEGDFDHDGISNGDEYRNSTDPTDYFNGALPTITVLAGDNQRGPAGETLPIPLTVRVTNQQGALLINAPVSFHVESGNGEIVLTTGTGSLTQVQTNAAGEASVFCHAPQTRGSRSTIAADCRSGSQTATVRFVETAEAFIQATPESLAFALNLPGTQSKTVELHNAGPAPLDFVCETETPSYRFQDSDAPDGPVYEWNDISNTGTLLSAVSQSDDDYEAVDLPFSFPFFGQLFSRIYVSSNGFVTVGTGASQGWHGFLPGVDMAPGEIAAFHTDLNPAAGGHIYYVNESDRSVIQFDQVQQSNGSGQVTFQIILEQTGAITFLYKAMNGTLNAASVGLQNLLQDQGVEVIYNKPYLRNGLAVRFTRDDSWLQVSPASGQVEPGQTVEVTATADGARLFEGNYAGLLRVRSAADQSVLELPVTAITNAAPVVELVAPQRNTGVALGETLSVEAQAQDRSGHVTRVEFYDGTNLIGAVTNPLFAIAWQPSHAGSFVLTARATDDLGATSISLPLSVRVEEDSDGDGLGDQWEIANFGNLNQKANDDFDGDHRNNLREFHDGTPGNDYYNGETPHPVLLTRTRAASKTRQGFGTLVPTNPPRYFLQRDVVTHLIGGNPESPVEGTIMTRVDRDRGFVVEETKTGNPPSMDLGSWAPSPPSTETTRIDRRTIPSRPEDIGGAYDDPPNLIDDHEAILEQTTTLSDEYTTDQLVSRTRAALPPVPPFDAPFSILDDATFADFDFFRDDETAVYISQSKYQFKWNPSPNLPEHKKIVWLEIFYPFDDPRTRRAEDFTPITTVRSWEGTANETPVYDLTPSVPGQYSITTLPSEPMVDGNGDGQMDFSAAVIHSADATSQDKPYRFWINDDNDTALSYDEGGQPHPAEVETVPSSRKDCDAHQIVSKRNLEDFSRLWIDLGPLQYQVLGGSVQVGLKWKTVDAGNPAINIYPSEDGKGSTDYLTDDAAAARQIAGVFNNAVSDKNNKQTVDRNGTFMFKADFWNGVTIENSKKCLLLEGVTEGKGELAVVFLDRNGNELTTGSTVWLALKDIKKMYQRANATPDALVPPYVSNAGTFDENSINYAPDVSPHFEQPDDEDPQCLLFVHGWKATYDDAINASETMFKRLWWQGYKGRFAAFRWPTQTSISSYNTSEWLAWKYGISLHNYVENYLKHQVPDYIISIAAHSMGNVVTGSALKRGMTVNRYFLMQAAIPSGCYKDSVNNYVRFLSAETARPTPDTAAEMGYRLHLESVMGNVTKFVSFFNIDDYALATGTASIIPGWPFQTNWEKNQVDYKPDIFTSGYYSFGANATSYFVTSENPSRVVTDLHETLSFVARPRSKAAGAEPHNATVFVSVLNLEAACNFGAGVEDHSGQFSRRIQELVPFYRRMATELKQ